MTIVNMDKILPKNLSKWEKTGIIRVQWFKHLVCMAGGGGASVEKYSCYKLVFKCLIVLNKFKIIL